MHRLPSKLAIYRLRLAALLLWVNYLLFIAAMVVLGTAVYEKSQDLVMKAIVLMIVCGLSVAAQWLVALQTKCPLCITPVLVAKRCSKNRKAKTFLGSYRLRVANNVIFRNYFRCPYCSEPTELQVRSRRPRQSN